MATFGLLSQLTQHDSNDNAIKMEESRFKVIQQVAKSFAPNQSGELDIQLVEEEHTEPENPHAEGTLPPQQPKQDKKSKHQHPKLSKRKYCCTQRKKRRLLQLKIAKQASYFAPIFDNPNKRRRFTFNTKCKLLNVLDFYEVLVIQNQ